MNDPSLASVDARMRGLVRKLESCGALKTAKWFDAFSSVPRHVFVPRWYEQTLNEGGIAVWNERGHTDEDAWLSAVYSDTTLVTALDPATAKRVGKRAWTGVATSSSTEPGLMARMLEALSVHDGAPILEIGTGTGYNAALLCARLGPQLVHSIDVDPELVEAARERLARLSYKPHLRAADGQAGAPDGAPFQRIIATCSVPRIPQAWVDQLADPQGILLTDLHLGIEGGLVRFQPQPGGEMFGIFTKATGRFMPARHDAQTYTPPARAPYAPETATRPTTVTANDIRSTYSFRLLLTFTLPRVELVYHLDDGITSLQFQTADGAWARTPLSDAGTVTYSGTGELWQQVEAAWNWWRAQPSIDHQDFGITRAPDGRMTAVFLPDATTWDLGT